MHTVLLVVGVALVAAVAVALARSPKWRQSAPRASLALRLAAVVVAFGTGVALLPLLIADRAGPVGIAVTVLPPVVLTLLAAAAPLLSRAAAGVAATWTATALMFAFVVVYGLGVGGFYAPTAFVLLASAIATTPTTGRPPSQSGMPAGS